VLSVRPAQATLVPVSPGEVTSNAGWVPGRDDKVVTPAVERLRAAGVRVSLFVDPDPRAIQWAKERGADRVELYTEPFAREFERGAPAAQRSFDVYRDCALLAHSIGLGINAGHDLDLENLVLFRELPHLDEVSIGHAIVSRAIFVGLERAVGEYLAVLAK
jgi:pyridoxine 5-phosphate synthase